MAPGSRPDLFALRRRPLRERWLDLGFQRAVVALAAVVGLLLLERRLQAQQKTPGANTGG